MPIQGGILSPDMGVSQNPVLQIDPLSQGILGGGTVGGFTAYHGSGRDFNKFDEKAAGSGEGTDYEGSGMYFSDNPQTAQYYAKQQGHGAGNVYETQINAQPEHFLDWDKPISQQPAPAQPVLQQLQSKVLQDPPTRDSPLAGILSGDALAGMLVSAHDDAFGRGPAQDLLNKAGVPGIKFADDRNPGSTNYVVFNDKLLNIVKKNGKPVNGGQ